MYMKSFEKPYVNQIIHTHILENMFYNTNESQKYNIKLVILIKEQIQIHTVKNHLQY